MKLVYEPGEKERLSEQESLIFDASNPDRVYSLDFTVTNPSLAQMILMGMMNGHFPEIDIGIDIQGINIMSLSESKEYKAKLHQMIDEIMP